MHADASAAHAAARATLRRLAMRLTDAIQRQEVHQWSRGVATTTVELELRALCDARDALEVMARALDGAMAATRVNGRETERAGAALERARRRAFAATMKALESVSEEREALRRVREFLEMPGDLEMYARMMNDGFEVMKSSESPLRAATEATRAAETPTSFLGAKERDDLAVSDEDVSEEEAVRLFETFNAYSQPMTPRTYHHNGYQLDSFESEVKSNRYGDSPGGISEDSAYGAQDDADAKKGAVKASKTHNGGAWVAVALGAIAAAGLMRAAATPQVAALKALAALKMGAFKRRAAGAAQKVSQNALVKAKEAFTKKKRAAEATPMADRRATYVVKHTRAAFEGDAGLEALEHAGTRGVASIRVSSDRSSFVDIPSRDYRWKPSVMIGRG